MRRHIITTALLFLLPSLALGQNPAAAPAQAATDEQALRQLDRQALEAGLKGDRAFFEGHTAETLIFTNTAGKVTTRAEVLKNWQPPPADLKFSLERQDVQVHLYGDAAVVSGRTVGTIQAGAQTLRLNERTTDTYVREGGKWRLVASHTSDLPPERAVAMVDPKVYAAYVGEYRFTPSLVYVVTSEGGRLMGQPTNQGKPSGPKVELLPASETRFFLKESNNELVFVKDDKGKVTHALFREQGQEIKMEKIK